MPRKSTKAAADPPLEPIDPRMQRAFDAFVDYLDELVRIAEREERGGEQPSRKGAP